MRTKTNERRRYSLRAPKKRGAESVKSPTLQSPKLKKLKAEENGEVKLNKISKQSSPKVTPTKSTPVKLKPAKLTPGTVKVKQDTLENDKQQKNIQNKPVKVQKTKRKGKPSKSAAKEDNDYPVTNVECSITIEQKAPQQPKPVSPTVENKSEELRLEEVSESNQEEEFPVYTALEHAIVCDTEEKSCEFPKCSIAKQFLAHSESCPKKEKCTICKAMDIMVCQHAENCETPLEKCCPIPNCDRVRYMVLEEWVKLKHRHHDIMTQVFQGLLHAWKCSDESCDSILCENIKTVLLHTRSCQKDEKSCRTKKFIVQLCEYHQQTCLDQQCNVEFCQENRKRKADAPRKKKDNCENFVEVDCSAEKEETNRVEEEPSYSSGAAKPIQNFTPSSFYFPGSGVPTGSVVPPWNVACPPHAENMTFPSSQVAYTFPYMAWQPFGGSGYGMNPFQQPQSSSSGNNLMDGKEENQAINWPQHDQATAESKNVDAVTDQPSTPCLSHSQESTSNANKFCTIQEIPDVENNDRYSSPTDVMYYQLWPNAKDTNAAKASLPRLSPNELQTILLTREGENMQQMLSPVQNNRAQFSEAPILINEYQTSQDSELDENPIAAIDSGPRHPQVDRFIVQEKRMEEMEENLKDQETWSKIDFIKEQSIRQGFDVDTETADETENESVSESSIYCSIQDEGYFIKERHENVDMEEADNTQSDKDIQMTAMEKNYLAILQGQQQEQL